MVNPYANKLPTLPGSRVLLEPLGLIGVTLRDLKKPERLWAVTNVYAPIPGRALGGIRVKLQDARGFVSFCNQRDLELLLELGKPGDFCPWTGEEYPELSDRSFYGFCADDEDLEDDLFDREMELRAHAPGVLPYGLEITRRIHLSSGRDCEELYMMMYDCDPETGYGPDARFETLEHRWTRVERTSLRWEQAL